MQQQRSTTIALARLVVLISIVGLGFMLSNSTALGTSDLSVMPTTVRFPATALGTTSYQSVTITNNGTSTETLSSYTTPSAKFGATSGRCGPPDYSISIPAGSSCNYEFSYSPSNPGADSGAGTISFESGAILNLLFAVGPVDGVSRIWADGDCSGAVNPVDSLKTLKTDAGLAPAQTVAGCPVWGSNVTVNGITVQWGDVDCSGSVSPVDSLKVLKTDAGLPPAQTAPNCPAMGSTVQVVG